MSQNVGPYRRYIFSSEKSRLQPAHGRTATGWRLKPMARMTAREKAFVVCMCCAIAMMTSNWAIMVHSLLFYFLRTLLTIDLHVDRPPFSRCGRAREASRRTQRR